MPSRLLAPFCSAGAALLLAAAAAAQAPVFQPRPCDDAPEDARCGTVRVPENRDQPGGRMIDLNVVVVPARTAAPARYAVNFFSGGPGQAATDMAGGFAEEFQAVREDRDLLFIDQRGTGRSARLPCVLRDTANPQSYLDGYLPPERVARCLDDMRRVADITRYGYLEMTRDVEAVRQALGYAQLDLWGGSYGTRAAQVYMRAYPGSVRSAVLAGVVPPGYYQPQHYARSTEAALEGLITDCRADAACAAAFPDFAREVRAVSERLGQAPGTARITDPETGARITLRLDRETYIDLVRRMLYDAYSSAQLPWLVHRAYEGDYGPAVRQSLQDRRGYARYIHWGLALTITCSEDVPFVDAQAAARDNGVTLLGDWRVREQTRACQGFPRYPVPGDYHQLVRLDIPTLLISGQYDPVTPPSGGERSASALPHSLHVVVPHAPHSPGGMVGAECVHDLVLRFYHQLSVQGLDTACVRQVRRPPFVTEVSERITLDRAALQRFAGEYVAADGGAPIRIEALDGVLRGDREGDAVLLSPLSPTRFAMEARPPGFEVEFSADARTMTLRIPGEPDALFRRTP